MSVDEKIAYRDFTITRALYEMEWVGVHNDYDPTPWYLYDGPSDTRIFYGATVEEVKAEIDVWYDELEPA